MRPDRPSRSPTAGRKARSASEAERETYSSSQTSMLARTLNTGSGSALGPVRVRHLAAGSGPVRIEGELPQGRVLAPAARAAVEHVQVRRHPRVRAEQVAHSVSG